MTDSRQVRILCLEFDISRHLSFSFQLVMCECFYLPYGIVHGDLAAVFLAHIVDFSLELSLITIMCMAVVLRPKLSGQLYAFHT